MTLDPRQALDDLLSHDPALLLGDGLTGDTSPSGDALISHEAHKALRWLGRAFAENRVLILADETEARALVAALCIAGDNDYRPGEDEVVDAVRRLLERARPMGEEVRS
jgi:hypothetical protein